MLALRLDQGESAILEVAGITIEVTHVRRDSPRAKVEIHAPEAVVITRRHPEKTYTREAATGRRLTGPLIDRRRNAG